MFNYLPGIFLFAVFFGIWLILHSHQRREREKRALPLRDDYLAAHQLQEPVCHACGSHEVVDVGLSHGRDEKRFVSCAQCGALLYRFSRASAADVR